MAGLTKEELTTAFKRWRKPIRQWLVQTRGVAPYVADDLAQEVFVRLLRYPTEEEIENLQGYVFRIAANVSNEWNERANQRKAHDDSWLDDLLVEKEEQPEEQRATEDEQEAIARCLGKLPARQREVLVLHIHEGLTYKQIAEQREMTYRTVLRLLTRAYATMRQLLAAEDAAASIAIPPSPEILRLREIETRKSAPPAAPPINERTVRFALATTRYRLEAAAEFFQCSRSQMLILTRRYVPDYAETRTRLRAEEHAARVASIIRALETWGFNLLQASKALGQGPSFLSNRVLAFVPDFEERRADYFRRIEEQERKAREEKERQEAEAKRLAEEQAEGIVLLERLEAHIEEQAQAHRAAEAAALLERLEANRWALRPVAQSMQMSARRLVAILTDLNPNWEELRRAWMAERGKVPREELKEVTAEQCLQALESCNYNMAATARLLGRSDEGFHYVARRLLPDFDERRTKFLEERERQKKQEADERWERELKRRGAFFSELNRKRWEGTADARRTEHLARIAQHERERAELIEAHAKELTALALEEAQKIQEVEREYGARRSDLRQRQIGERKRLTILINGIISLIPGYRKHRRKLMDEKRATQAAQIMAALDKTGGRVRTAARLLGGLSSQTVRHFKVQHWMNQAEGAMRLVLAIPVAMAERVMPEFPTNAPITTWELMKCPLCDGDVWVGHESREAFTQGQAEVCCITCAYTKPEGHRAYRLIMRDVPKREDETEN